MPKKNKQKRLPGILEEWDIFRILSQTDYRVILECRICLREFRGTTRNTGNFHRVLASAPDAPSPREETRAIRPVAQGMNLKKEDKEWAHAQQHCCERGGGGANGADGQGRGGTGGRGKAREGGG
ncbi:hypothetical protein ACLKA7_002197 [Drosophila subpalustris]